MRAINILIWFMLWIVNAAMAQQADSIIVTYDNQHITIAMPEFGKKTTIKMADSSQIIEFDVSRRKLTDLPQSALYPTKNSSSEKPLKKTKWFSQVEAGYVIGFISKDRFPYYSSYPLDYHVNNNPLPGFRLGLSVFDQEKLINKKLSYNIGFKFGVETHFRTNTPNTENWYDTINQIGHIYIDYNPYTITRLQLLIPVGMRYSLRSGKSMSKISFGANIGTALNIFTFRDDDVKFKNSMAWSPLILQPYLGFEYGKIGILSTVNFELINSNLAEIKYSVGISLTYRFF